MLKGMSDRKLFRAGMALLALCAALPALADTQFRIRRMTRNDVPPGKGQCDIRLQVDNEVEVSVRRDMVMIRTLSGHDPRDDGSECNAPLPDRNLEGFNFQVIDSRNEIRLVAEPSRPQRLHRRRAHPRQRQRRKPLPLPAFVGDRPAAEAPRRSGAAAGQGSVGTTPSTITARGTAPRRSTTSASNGSSM